MRRSSSSSPTRRRRARASTRRRISSCIAILIAPSWDPSILARVPADLDALMEQVVVNAASRLGFRIEQVRGRRAYAIEFGNEALVDSLPGVPGGSSFVGSFDREYAVEDETIDFFASGHPLVEGLLAHFEEDPKGRVARLELTIPGPAAIGTDRHLQRWPAVRCHGVRRRREHAAGMGGGVPRAADWSPRGCRRNTPPRMTGARSWSVSHQSSGTAARMQSLEW